MSPRAAPWSHLLLAAAHGAVSSGIWFLALACLPVSKGGGEPFPCAARSCCCTDAVDCRTSCCCSSPGSGAERTDRSRGDVLQAAGCDGGAPRTGMLVRLPPCILDDRSLLPGAACIDFDEVPRMRRPPSSTPAPEGPVPRADDVSRLFV